MNKLTELTSILTSYRDSLDLLRQNFDINDPFRGINPALVKEPLEEVVKLSELMKAHATKVGIVFKPSMLTKGIDAAYKEVKDMSSSNILMISLMAQLTGEDLSKLFYNELLDAFKALISSVCDFVEEILSLANLSSSAREQISDAEDSSGRLVSVGKIWTNCDALVNLGKNGKLGILSSKVKESKELIEDGLAEFEEWSEKPEKVGTDDFFGSDEESDIEPAPKNMSDQEKKFYDNGDADKFVEYCKTWVTKIKLIKILYNSLTKSLPSMTSGSMIDEIYQVQRKLVRLLDQFVVSLMLNAEAHEDTQNLEKEITTSCRRIVQIVRRINEGNENKIKWCDAWETKFR